MNQFPFNTVDLDDKISIAYWDEGKSEETLLFIHGLTSNIQAWSKNLPILKKHFRCVAIDLPGYGKSVPGIHSGKMDFYAEVISEFIQALKLSNLTIVGHSMGGQIAMATALLYPKLIKILVLVAPAGLESFTKKEINWIKKNYTEAAIASLTEDQIRLNFTNDQDRNYKVIIRSLHGMLYQPVFERLNEIKCPTLIIFGNNDYLIPHPILHKDKTPEEIAKLGVKKIPGAKLVLFDNCGHFVQFEKPDEFNKTVIEFLIKGIFE